MATAGTRLEGATLELETVPGRIACRTCEAESRCDDHVLLCGCGSADVSVVAGDDLVVTSVAVRREQACV
jgi:hydrogenase nickel incorporation protein HypA/HybF